MVALNCGGGGRRSSPQEAGRGRGDRFACNAWKPTRPNAARRRVWFDPDTCDHHPASIDFIVSAPCE
ncbi:hypothetical protein Y032_0057g2738 [Ancylostoma ceylanicum]|uniref:Uncharacterized protein n=1 Tax=Ancylostoma ceylanicum TaxID=53326 RepID=A0A016U566_9BILA|nr:hypothetical protein Y032_0057g2738 [Ancylostoma ceylanicum]